MSFGKTTVKPMSGNTGWFKKLPGAITEHADGSKWRKYPDGRWLPVKDDGRKKSKAEKPSYSIGQVATINGKHYMKVADNRYSPVVQSKSGTWTHDATRKGVQMSKNAAGKIQISTFRPLGHEVMRASLQGESDSKQKLHSQYKITDAQLKKQKKQLEKNPVHSSADIRENHIVRVKPGSTIGLEDQKKEGIVGRVKRIHGKVAQIVNDVGRHFQIPLHALEMAKSRKLVLRLKRRRVQ